MGSVEEGSVLWSVADLDDLGTGQQLHDQSRSDNGRDTELHEGTAVGGQDDTDPVEGISRVRRHDAEQRNLVQDISLNSVCPSSRSLLKSTTYLAADQEDEESDGSP